MINKPLVTNYKPFIKGWWFKSGTEINRNILFQLYLTYIYAESNKMALSICFCTC